MARVPNQHNFQVCLAHTSLGPLHKGCPAIRLKGQLQRLGFHASQYQGFVSTNAPADLVRNLADEAEHC